MKHQVAILVTAGAVGSLWAGKPEVEPKYASEKPLYGKIAFDLEGKTVVWTVLDKEKGKKVLYFDRNADGDLTGKDERLESETGSFDLGTFVDPHSKAEHTQLFLNYSEEKGTVMFRLNWKGKDRVAGGYAVAPGPYLKYSEDPVKAPMIQPIAEGPFEVQPWMIKPLVIGKETDVKFFLGHAGKGENAFCGVRQDFLPKGDGLKATLIYQTETGEEKRSVHKLLDRC